MGEEGWWTGDGEVGSGGAEAWTNARVVEVAAANVDIRTTKLCQAEVSLEFR